MRDLYRKLELEPTATPDEIAAALEKHPELEAQAAILLDEDRRSLYDRAHQVLKLIGTLRFRLDLDKSDNSFIDRHPDFAIMPKPRLTSAPQEAAGDESAGARGRDTKGRGLNRWLVALLAMLVAAAAAVLILKLY